MLGEGVRSSGLMLGVVMNYLIWVLGTNFDHLEEEQTLITLEPSFHLQELIILTETHIGIQKQYQE